MQRPMKNDLPSSPYNFVPLPPRIVQPEWQDRVSHDLPLQEGLCAEIEIELHAHTPLLLGGRRDGQVVHFFSGPDGHPTIPGSSLRGMLRGVLELASFSRIARVHDRQLAARDVGSRVFADYGEAFVGPAQWPSGQRSDGAIFRSLAKTGWLRFDPNRGWLLHPCQHERVEHSTLKAAGLDVRDGAGLQADAQRMASTKYERLLPCLPELRLFAGNIAQAHVAAADPPRRAVALLFALAERVSTTATAPCPQERRLVVTGQVNDRKHREFLFHVHADAPIAVPAKVWRAFLDVHDVPARAGLEGSYAWLKRRRPFGALGMPVFYLPDKAGGIAHLGLCQMFKLPYPRTLHGCMGVHGQPAAADTLRRLDFAETLFGAVATDEARLAGPAAAPGAAGGLKSRVFFGDLRAVGTPTTAPAAFALPTVLASPKPGFHPAYFGAMASAAARPGHPRAAALPVQQRPKAQVQGAGGQAAPPAKRSIQALTEIRGVKRYPAHAPQEVQGVPKAQEQQDGVASQLRPVAAGARFSGRIRLHNVLPQELGALLWALLWGGDADLRHALGMGRPFGLGQVSLHLQAITARFNDGAAGAAASVPALPTDGDSLALVRPCMRAFEDYMQQQCPGWRQTPTLLELLAMARPGSLPAEQLKPMRFEMVPPPRKGSGVADPNQFRGALAEGWRLHPHTQRTEAASRAITAKTTP